MSVSLLPSAYLTRRCARRRRARAVMRSTLCHGCHVLAGALLLALLDQVLAGHEVGERDVGLELDLHALAELSRAEAGEEQRLSRSVLLASVPQLMQAPPSSL